MGIDEFLSRLEGVKGAGGQWQALCPAHDDHNPSLSVSLDGEKILLHCHAGCSADKVVDALGLRMGDLFVSGSTATCGHEVATYDYRDEQGELLFQVVRTEPKGFYQRRPDGHGGWINDLHDVPRVLYRLPELLAADPAEPVFSVEGEKDADRLAGLGLVATTNPGGAGKWRSEYSDILRGRHVVIIPDNDEPGQKHAEQAAKSLTGVASSVKVVDIPNLPPKGDVSDYLGADHTKEELMACVASAPAADIGRPKNDDPPHLTDSGNAQRLVRLHGHDLRYCCTRGKWLVWDGRRWAVDDTGEAMRRAKDTVRRIHDEASSAQDGGRRHLLASHALHSEGQGPLRSMLTLAQSEAGIPVLAEELDRDPWKLTVLNGTVDLKSGRLLPHMREDLSTKLAPVEYDADVICPRWEAFLGTVLRGDADLIRFVQRASGYALTGSTKEQVLFLLYGTGANGKTTFLEVIRSLLGEYARTADSSTFIQRARPGIPNDIARLAGARLVTVQEVERGNRLAEAVVKQMTGGDRVQARFLYQEHFEFDPNFKLFLATNHKPVIGGTDHAIWRRLRLVPFTVTIPEAEQDKDLVAKLKREAPGILAWAVRGCLEWQQEGLGTAPAVMTATAEYRAESDILGGFLSERCVEQAGRAVSASELYGAYKRWADENGERVISQTVFGRQLSERGFEKTKKSGRIFWKGLEMLARDTQDGWDGSCTK